MIRITAYYVNRGGHMGNGFLYGTVLAVRVGPFWHVGILSEPTGIFGARAISCSRRRGGVTEESILEFSQGSEVIDRGYPSSLPPELVLWRARSRLGAPWKLLSANCEHFVAWCHGLEVTSPQLRAAGVFAGAALLAVGGWSLSRA